VHLLILTASAEGGKALLPALDFLDHSLAVGSLAGELQTTAKADVVLVDGTGDLAAASHACKLLSAAEHQTPILVVVSDGALAALKAAWGFDDWVLPAAQPAEVETRLRLLSERRSRSRRATSIGDLSIDEDTYVVRLRGMPLDLTYREFELLKHLVAHPSRVFTRGQLLQEVWGYDYYGGTRTVDVHIRRLRAKLGAEHESLIGTVRGVGYKLDPQGLSEG
jgi:DNA-binding response OmpR family regulator